MASANFFEEQIRSLLLEHIVDFGCAKASKDRPFHSREASTVLILDAFWSFHLFVFVLQENGVERIRHLISLGNGKPNFFTFEQS